MKKVKTRDRILQASLRLFNGLGEPNVTTLLISDELEISPGNLYYHFKSKGDIVEELFDAYEAELLDLLAVPKDVEISLGQFEFFLHMLFEAVARYHFLYQDLVNVLSRYEVLQARFRKILQKKTQGFLTLCDSFRSQQRMTIDDAALAALCEQLTLTVCYWSSFDTLSHLASREMVDPGKGVYQVLHLILPYMTPEGQEYIRLTSESYR
ncbi:MAG TPA: TetR/AcrR family transcriptional regulator [Marinobacter sp.]|nr:TetR/AcrR family transcriptional regulator [Marinobacter sp.]